MDYFNILMKKIFTLFLGNILLLASANANGAFFSDLTIQDITSVNTSCTADDGTATVTTTGGVLPFTYEWEDLANAGTIISTSNPATGLGSSAYSLTVTDAAGCAATGTIVVGAPPSPVISNVIISAPTCAASDGFIELLVETGFEPYTFNWENTMNPGTSISTNNPLTGIAAGMYDITVTGNNGCSTSINVPISSPDAPEIVDIASNNATCGQSNGAALVTVSGGEIPYTYNWEDANGPGVSISTTEIISNLPEGIYNVVVTDYNGCDAVGSVTITGTPPLILTTTQINPTCSGILDGSAAVSAEGGSFYYTYEWSNGSIEQTALNLPGGTHRVTVTDTDGCSDSIQIVLIQPDEILFETTTSNSTCIGLNDGVITVFDVSGGDGAPYLYSSDGINFSTDSIITGLGEGLYEIFVQDSNGCIALNTQLVESSTELILDYGEDISINYGETVSFTPSTNFPLDTSLYTWTWAQDTSLIFNNLPYNPTAQPSSTTTYTVAVTDPNGCTVTDAITVRVNVRRDLFIPNVFSPNFDGSNDIFTIFGGVSVARIKTMAVYNRWGAKVYEANDFLPNDPQFGWDGQLRNGIASPGVYVYYIEVDFVNGTSDSYRGDVTLVR